MVTVYTYLVCKSMLYLGGPTGIIFYVRLNLVTSFNLKLCKLLY